mgnify:CR=1 FL=1
MHACQDDYLASESNCFDQMSYLMTQSQVAMASRRILGSRNWNQEGTCG